MCVAPAAIFAFDGVDDRLLGAGNTGEKFGELFSAEIHRLRPIGVKNPRLEHRLAHTGKRQNTCAGRRPWSLLVAFEPIKKPCGGNGGADGEALREVTAHAP